MSKRSPKRIKSPPYGCFGSTAYHRRPRSPASGVKHIPSKQFCEEYQISRWVAYSLHQKKKLLSGIKFRGKWMYAVYPGCEEDFYNYLETNRKKRQPREYNRSDKDYNLGF